MAGAYDPLDYQNLARNAVTALLEARRRKMAEARHRRREWNPQVGQFTLPFQVT